MEPCPKCHKQYPPGKEICPHCGLVFRKWAASQSRVAPAAVEPEPHDQETEPTEEVKSANLGYLVGWAAGVIPVVGIVIALVHYYRDYNRLAFQALALGTAALVLISFDASFTPGIRDGAVYILFRFILVPLLLVYLVRMIGWPLNSPRSDPPTKLQPIKLSEYLRHRAPWLGIAAFLILTAALLLTFVPTALEAYFLLFSIPITAGAIGVFAIPILFFRSVIGKAKRNLRWMDWMAGLTACLLTFFVFLHGNNVLTAQVKANMQTLIPVLDDYRQQHGAYPKTLDLLDARLLPHGPRCYTDLKRPPYYAVHKDGSYSLICRLYVFMRMDYSSATGTWEIYD